MTKEVLTLALEALEGLFDTNKHNGGVAVWRLGGSAQPKEAIAAIKEALAQEQEPVTWMMPDGNTADKWAHWEDCGNLKDLVKAIEAKLKENT